MNPVRLLVPWNVVGVIGGRRFRYAPGSLVRAKRVPLLVDHTWSSPVGSLVDTWADERGQWGVLRIRDAALARRYRGVSIQVDPATAARRHENGADTILSAVLIECSLTNRPVFPTFVEAP